MSEEAQHDLEYLEQQLGREFRESVEQLLYLGAIDEDVLFDWAAALRNYREETDG